MEGKAAVMGSSEFVTAFSALGLDTFATEAETEKVQETAGRILKEKYVLVVVAENIAKDAQAVFETTQRNALPCVVVVPFTSAPSGIATEGLSRMLKLATGINILAN